MYHSTHAPYHSYTFAEQHSISAYSAHTVFPGFRQTNRKGKQKLNAAKRNRSHFEWNVLFCFTISVFFFLFKIINREIIHRTSRENKNELKIKKTQFTSNQMTDTNNLYSIRLTPIYEITPENEKKEQSHTLYSSCIDPNTAIPALKCGRNNKKK